MQSDSRHMLLTTVQYMKTQEQILKHKPPVSTDKLLDEAPCQLREMSSCSILWLRMGQGVVQLV